MILPLKKTVLFYRDFHNLTGGHLKIWHYYNHVANSQSYEPAIYFSKKSEWSDNPWSVCKDTILTKWQPELADVLFLGGMDWLSLSTEERMKPPAPIINLIQHVRHANTKLPLYDFLKYPAARICVSEEVANAILSTGQVNGEVFVNPNALDIALRHSDTHREKDIPWLLIGYKRPELSMKVEAILKGKGINAKVLHKQLPRTEYLTYIERAEVVLFLPNDTEGFYLPALEAMALEALVICPDCIGNREFCTPNYNGVFPAYNLVAVMNAVDQVLLSSPDKIRSLLDNAQRTAREATAEKEAKVFMDVLNKVTKDVYE